MKEYVIKKVLAAIDFSHVSLNALDTAASIAAKHNASLTIIHVMENTKFLYTPAGGLSAIALLPELLRTASERLSEISMKIRDQYSLHIRQAVLSGNAAEGICQEAWHEEIDLVVIGSHGSSDLKELLIGTTAYFVVKSCPAPVLTVPSGNRWLSFRKILFPVRADSNSYEKYDFIRPIIQKEESSVMLAGIINKSDSRSNLNVEMTVEDIYNKLASDNVACHARFHECKNMARQVLEIADDEAPDLIVITTTTQTSIWEVFSLPFSQHVVNHSHFPVLSVRPKLEVETQLKAVEYVDERLASLLAIN